LMIKSAALSSLAQLPVRRFPASFSIRLNRLQKTFINPIYKHNPSLSTGCHLASSQRVKFSPIDCHFFDCLIDNVPRLLGLRRKSRPPNIFIIESDGYPRNRKPHLSIGEIWSWHPILFGLTGHSGISSRVARRGGFLREF